MPQKKRCDHNLLQHDGIVAISWGRGKRATEGSGGHGQGADGKKSSPHDATTIPGGLLNSHTRKNVLKTKYLRLSTVTTLAGGRRWLMSVATLRFTFMGVLSYWRRRS